MDNWKYLVITIFVFIVVITVIFISTIKKGSDWYKVIRKCRISIISVILVVSALFVPQGQDVLRSTAQGGKGYQICVFEIALISWALIVWYGGRFLLNPDFNAKHTGTQRILRNLWGEVFIPRFLGAIGCGGVGIAILFAVRGIKEIDGIHFWLGVGLGIFNIILGCILYLLFYKRKALCNFLQRKIFQTSPGCPRMQFSFIYPMQEG